MAAGVLRMTPEADWAASITGHLGPQAPPEFDGIVYICIARRTGGDIIDVGTQRHALSSTERHPRQCQAATLVLEAMAESLQAAKQAGADG
jgi:nicotinamide mononucleotide (NMN) deamidase PncC